jgi:transketolase
METNELKKKAAQLRLSAVRMIYEGGEGHPGPAMSAADMVTALYYDIMRVKPSEPAWEDRDRFILSKGHACPIYYAALSDAGYYGGPVEHFDLRALGSVFQGHPVMGKTPGVDMTSGSLGNGIAVGAGMAFAAKYRQKDWRVFVLTGDGELQEGICWEGINTAYARKLDNMYVFVDNNGYQSGGKVVGIGGDMDIAGKFAAFGWHTQTIDGHNFDEIKSAMSAAAAVKGVPHVIVCRTLKGKGLSFMQGDNSWHKKTPTLEQMKLAEEELGAIIGGAS